MKKVVVWLTPALGLMLETAVGFISPTLLRPTAPFSLYYVTPQHFPKRGMSGGKRVGRGSTAVYDGSLPPIDYTHEYWRNTDPAEITKRKEMLERLLQAKDGSDEASLTELADGQPILMGKAHMGKRILPPNPPSNPGEDTLMRPVCPPRPENWMLTMGKEEYYKWMGQAIQMGRVDLLKAFLHDAINRGVTVTSSWYNLVLKVCSLNGDPTTPLLLEEMEWMKLEPSKTSYICVFDSFHNRGASEEGFQYFRDSIGLKGDVTAMYDTLLYVAAKHGLIDELKNIVDEISQKSDKAVQSFDLNDILFAIANECDSLELSAKTAKDFISFMDEKYNWLPSAQAYSAVIHRFVVDKDRQRAEDFIKDFKDTNPRIYEQYM